MDAAALLRIPTLAVTRDRVVQAIEADHRLVLLLAEPPSLATAVLEAAAANLLAHGRFVHTPDPARLRLADLDQPDPRIVVAIDAADTIPRPSLLALDAHVRTGGTQVLLAGPPACRMLAATAGLPALHTSPLLVAVPPLPAPDAADFLCLSGTRATARLLRAASGEPRLLARLGRRPFQRLLCVTESPPLAALLDRPSALLAAAFVLAVAATGLSVPLNPPPADQPAHQPAKTAAAMLPPVAPFSPDIVAPGAVPAASGSTDDGVTVDREEPDALSPRHVTARPGDTLRTLYAHVYHGLTPPPLAAVRALNPAPVRPGASVVFPPPDEGWPAP